MWILYIIFCRRHQSRYYYCGFCCCHCVVVVVAVVILVVVVATVVSISVKPNVHIEPNIRGILCLKYIYNTYPRYVLSCVNMRYGDQAM